VHAPQEDIALLAIGTKALAAYVTDRSGTRSDELPLAVVHARRTDDVTVTLRHAHALCVPVVPRGAGTGLSGGARAPSSSPWPR
jgi:glycolate oxidase